MSCGSEAIGSGEADVRRFDGSGRWVAGNLASDPGGVNIGSPEESVSEAAFAMSGGTSLLVDVIHAECPSREHCGCRCQCWTLVICSADARIPCQSLSHKTTVKTSRCPFA